MACLRETLDKWLKLNGDAATWRVLKVAIDNVSSIPGHGKDVYFIVCIFFFNAISYFPYYMQVSYTYLAAYVSKLDNL